MATTEAQPLAVSIDEAARRLSVGRTLLYDLIRQGRMRAVKLGVRTVIPVTEIARILGENDDTNSAA
jgi:excisionase family DNA binding protein